MNKKLLCAISLAYMAVACNSLDKDALVQYGEISVALGGPKLEVTTKAETISPTSPEAADYSVSLYDSAGQLKYSAQYNEFGTRKLTLGTYYVTAENCTAAEAESANDNKGCMRLFGRSKDITLSSDKLTATATIDCTVANARVAVSFDSSVSGKFSDLKVEITGTTKTVTVAETETGVKTETWFNPQTISYKISGTFTELNKYVEIINSRTLEAMNNIELVVRLNTDNGQLSPEITINSDIDDPTEVPGEFNPYV